MAQEQMKESTQTVLCTCNTCKTTIRVSLIGGPIEEFYCPTCKKNVSDFESKPVMIPIHTKEYNPFSDGAENW